jgi:hypothetical protein
VKLKQQKMILGIIGLLRNDTEFQQLYNCTFYDFRRIPVENRRNIPVGVALAVLGIIQWVCFKFQISNNYMYNQ